MQEAAAQGATQMADIAAASSIAGTILSFTIEWTPVAQFLLVCVSIIAGLTAIFYHLLLAPRRVK